MLQIWQYFINIICVKKLLKIKNTYPLNDIFLLQNDILLCNQVHFNDKQLGALLSIE